MNRVRLLVLVFTYLCFFSNFSFAQDDTVWVRRYNGEGNSHDFARDIAVSGDGSIVIMGQTMNSQGNYDFVTIKYGSNGTLQWARTFDGYGPDDDNPTAMAVSLSGEIYVCGSSRNANGNDDYVVVKYSPTGDTIWTRLYDNGSNDRPNDLCVDIFGNVIVGGASQSSSGYDCLTIKYNSSGDPLWAERFNGIAARQDSVIAVRVDNEGYIYVTGRSVYYQSGNYHESIVTIKYRPDGYREWFSHHYEYGGYGNDITTDGVGNVYVVGYQGSFSFYENYNFITLKYSPEGAPGWGAVYNGPPYDQPDIGRAIAVDVYGNVYVTGESVGNSLTYDYATIKYNPSGSGLWVQRYDGPISSDDRSVDIELSGNDSLFVVGTSVGDGSSADILTILYDSNGNILDSWPRRYNGPANLNDRAARLAIGSSGIYACGSSENSNSTFDIVVIKYIEGPQPPMPNLTVIQPYYTQVSESWGTDYSIEYPQSNIQHIGAVIQNDGDEAASDIRVRFYVDGAPIGDKVIDNIVPSQTVLIDKEWAIPDNVFEDISVVIAIDPLDAIPESNEEDNDTTETLSFYYAIAPEGGPEPGREFDLREDTYGQFSNWKMTYGEFEEIIEEYILPNYFPLRYLGLLRGFWAIISGVGGYCYGMSATSLVYFEDPTLKPPGYDIPTFDMQKEEPVVDKIKEYHSKQLLEELEFIVTYLLPFSPTSELNDFKNHLIDDSTPQVLMVKGHAVVGCKLISREGYWIVPIYDVNDTLGPTPDQHIKDVNLLYNDVTDNCFVGTTWLDYSHFQSFPDSFPSGFPYKGINPVGKFKFFTPRLVFPDNIETKIRDFLRLWAETESQLHRIWSIFLSPVQTLTQNEFGERIGFIDGSFVNEIPGAAADTVYGMEIYRLPDDGQYYTSITGLETGFVHINFFIPQEDSSALLVIFDSLYVTGQWRASIDYSIEEQTFALTIDENNDGQPDTTVYPAYIEFITQGSPCDYTPGDCDHNGVPLELGDVIAMIGMYRGTVEPYYTCDCPPHGDTFAAEADPNGNCVPFELGDVVTEIGAYRGTAEASGCEDCPGSRR